jgi:Fe-S oxidoreductase
MVRLSQLGLDEFLGNDPAIWNCMVCNHCTVSCPLGIRMDQVVRRARNLPSARSHMPPSIVKGVETRLEILNVNGFTREDFLETIDWLNEEIADNETDAGAVIPVDQKGATYLYLPNPRELELILNYLTGVAKLFYRFGESWTMSSLHRDVTNWGYFIGDDDIMRRMALQVVEDAERLEIKYLVLSECGHAYFVLKRLLSSLAGRKPSFEVLSMPELMIQMVDKGVIRFDPEKYRHPIAYHDPCNIGRKGGQFDDPRRLLAQICGEVVELIPNRMEAICCGGGGGMLQDSSSKPRRMIAGKAKADQIRESGVRNLATSCLSCHRQLSELVKHYKLDVKVHTVVALASEALADKRLTV